MCVTSAKEHGDYQKSLAGGRRVNCSPGLKAYFCNAVYDSRRWHMQHCCMKGVFKLVGVVRRWPWTSTKRASRPRAWTRCSLRCARAQTSRSSRCLCACLPGCLLVKPLLQVNSVQKTCKCNSVDDHVPSIAADIDKVQAVSALQTVILLRYGQACK